MFVKPPRPFEHPLEDTGDLFQITGPRTSDDFTTRVFAVHLKRKRPKPSDGAATSSLAAAKAQFTKAELELAAAKERLARAEIREKEAARSQEAKHQETKHQETRSGAVESKANDKSKPMTDKEGA